MQLQAALLVNRQLRLHYDSGFSSQLGETPPLRRWGLRGPVR